MDVEEIDELFTAIADVNKEYLWKCAGMDGNITTSEFTPEKIFSKIYQKIKKDEQIFEYFLSKRYLSSNRYICAKILLYSSDKQEIKKFLKLCMEENLQLDKRIQISLVKEINDPVFLDEYLEIRKLSINDTIELILSINDQKYTDKWIEKGINKEVVLWNENIISLISGMKSEEYTDKWIQRREELAFSSFDIVSLINQLKSEEYTEKWIKRAGELHLSSYRIVDLIININKQEFTDKWIEKRKELGLKAADIVRLINNIDRESYTDKWIERKDELELKSHNIVELITEINDNDYIDKWIRKRNEVGFSNTDLVNLIINIDDTKRVNDYIKRRKELGLDKNDIIDLLIKIHNPEVVDNWIEKKEELNLTPEDFAVIISTKKDRAYIENCIENRRDELKFDSKVIAFLICVVADIRGVQGESKKDYVKSAIERRFEFELEPSEILKLMLSADFDNDYKYFIKKEGLEFDSKELEILRMAFNKKYLKKLLEQSHSNDTAKILLPPEMTIGVEIESLGKYCFALEMMSEFADWRFKEDNSLIPEESDDAGIEVVSNTYLRGANDSDTDSLKNICEVLKKFEQYTNDTCGGHIHIGAKYLTSVQSWKNLLELYANTEKILYLIANEEGSIPREGTLKFAAPISKDLEDAIDSGSINLENEDDLEDFTKSILKFQGEEYEDRYKGINFKNIAPGEIGTIEFRLANGTINSDTWIQNINLFGGIVKMAEELSKIQEKGIYERTELERRLLECLERLRNGDLEDEEKLEYLLEIVIPEKDREIYRKRYMVNKALLHENVEKEEELDKKIGKKGIRLSAGKIGRDVSYGIDEIRWNEAMEIYSMRVAECR